MGSIQLGAVLAKGLFPQIGAPGTTALRLALASAHVAGGLAPLADATQPARAAQHRDLRTGDGMDEFVLLSVAQPDTARHSSGAGIRRVRWRSPWRHRTAPVDFLWIALAAVGLLGVAAAWNRVQSRWPPPGSALRSPRDRVGLSISCSGRRPGRCTAERPPRSATLVGAIVIVPIGIAHAGAALFSPALLPAGCAVALLSSALPYSLEMYALPRLPTRTFGVLMSLSPALGALSGLCFLAERLTAIQWAAIASIMVASGGSAATSRPPPSPRSPLPD